MGPELWVGVAAVFVAGGAIGSAGTLLMQWILRKVDLVPTPNQVTGPEYRVMRKELAKLGRHMRNVDARLDFTEQLLGGSLQLAPPPSRLAPLEPEPDEDRDQDGDQAQDAVAAGGETEGE